MNISGVARGDGGGNSPPPPETGKIVVENFLATTFPIEFLSKISQHFPKIRVFRPNARKINAWFVNFFEKYAKIMHF